MAFLQGEVYMRKRDFAAAVSAFQRAVELSPNEGEHLAMLAWARLSAGLATLTTIKPDLVQAVAKSPRCARAHCYLGMVYKDEGELDKAQSSLRRAVELDPNLSTAASELRVVTMRKEKLQPKGLLDRLRKK
jgi:cytochrome c-type biogenesis protein CcmH/NrfG